MVRPTQFKVERGPESSEECRLSVTGELDLATTPHLEAEVNRALAVGVGSILIDLASVNFIDSTGLRMFLRLNEQAASDGWRLLLVQPSRQMRTILQVTGSADELPIAEESPSS